MPKRKKDQKTSPIVLSRRRRRHQSKRNHLEALRRFTKGLIDEHELCDLEKEMEKSDG
jgi:hypothetical protein